MMYGVSGTMALFSSNSGNELGRIANLIYSFVWRLQSLTAIDFADHRRYANLQHVRAMSISLQKTKINN